MSYAASEAEAFESEGFESEAFGEYGEGVGRRGRTPRTASGRGLAPMPQTQQSRNFVTYAALRQAMDKVGAQIKTNSDAITAVGTRLNSTAATLRKEFDERKKDTDAIRGDINQKTSLLALLPLLVPPQTVPAGAQIGVDAAGVAVFSGSNGPPTTAPAGLVTNSIPAPPTSIANALLPLLVIGGIGTGPGGGTSTGGLDNTMLLVLALVLANPPRS